MLSNLFAATRDWLTRAQNENAVDAADTKKMSRSELKRALVHIVELERQRDEMAIHVEEIRKELDVAAERHAATCEPIQRQLAGTTDAPTRVALRLKIDQANANLEAEVRTINDRLSAAEREYQYLGMRCIARGSVERELYRKGDPRLLAQVELNERNAGWAKSRLREARKNLDAATAIAAGDQYNAYERANAERMKLASEWEVEQVEAELNKARATIVLTKKQIMEC